GSQLFCTTAKRSKKLSAVLVRTLGLTSCVLLPDMAGLQLIIDFEPEEYFRIDQIVTGQLAIHSPWNILNPFSEGFTIKPNKIYVIQIKEQRKWREWVDKAKAEKEDRKCINKQEIHKSELSEAALASIKIRSLS
ncbi:hypothetical protein AVEN_5058-1, partial [Araneus ventricosus]